MNPHTLPVTTDDRLVWDTWLSVYRLPVLTVADAVGTVPALAERARTTTELAIDLSVDARALGVHLSMLAALGFIERRDDRWRAADSARTWLHPAAEGYFGPLLKVFPKDRSMHELLLATLRPLPDSEESPLAGWEHGDISAEIVATITEMMDVHSRAAAKALASQPLFADVSNVLDVGGGSAIFSIELAKAWPRLHASVMEIAAVVKEADRYIAGAGMTEKVRTETANMFVEPWPTGHDVHFLSNVFHDWSDETNRTLASKSFAALPSGGRIVLHEMLMDDDGCGPLTVAAFSMNLLIGTQGRQYSLSELRSVLEDAGFIGIDAQKTGGGYFSIVVGTKP